MSKNIGIFSFFTGAGFLDLGFEYAGFETLFVNESHKPFSDIYTSTRKDLNILSPEYGNNICSIEDYLDTSNLSSFRSRVKDAKAKHDLIGFIGGPPCPDFSVGGKNKGQHGENGRLSGSYVKLINELSPDFFLFENVKGLYRTSKHRKFFDELKTSLIQRGYYLTEKLINALEFGAPQYRERIILIGFKKNTLNDLGFKINGSPIIKNFNWEAHTKYNLKEVLAYKWPTVDTFIEDSIREKPIEMPLELTVEYWFKKNDVYNHPNSIHYFTPRAGLAKFKEIPEGDDSKKSYKRLHRWRYSPTAAYGNNEVHLHPYKARRITVAEALAIQSLPKEYVIPDVITLTNMFKTVGNGVPYLAAHGLAKTIFDFIFNNPIRDLKQSYAEVNR